MIKKYLAIVLIAFALCACKKTPEDTIVPVASVSLSQPEAEMEVGETVQLQAQISPSNATEKEVMWGSSKQSVATVSDAGLVTAVGEGSAKITATAGGKTATCVVTVTKPEGPVVHVESVSLDKTDASLEIGQSLTLTATVLPENAADKSVEWKSTNPEIAEVDHNGIVTAISSGTVTITVTTVDGEKVAACEITVAAPKPQDAYDGEENGHYWVDLGLPSGIKWATCNLGAEYSGELGDTFAWGETFAKTDWENPPYKWQDQATYKFFKYVDDARFGTVDNLTTLEPVDDAAHVQWGGQWRMPTEADYKELIDNCNYESVEQNGIRGAKLTSKINSQTIFFIASDYHTSSLDWTYASNSRGFFCEYLSSGSGFGVIGRGGLAPVRAVIGTPNTIPVESVEFDVNGISVQMGETRSLSVTVLPENATNKNITWSSTDPDVAVVDENGNMTAVGLGYTFIEATADGKTGYLYVSVMPRLESLSIEPENLTLEIGQTASVTVNVTPESVLDSYRCAYQNNNEDIIDVEETYDDLRFNITAKAAGEATFDFGVYVSGEWIIATCHVTVLFIEDEYDGETDGHKWVDLGLPSGIKWATCDVGADNSAQAGSLFAWGEIIPKDDDSAPYKWFDSATGKYLKYVLKPEFGEVDNLTTLEAEDDAARMNWGGEWRMPTLADIEELWENTTYEFVTQNGVPGGKITSKINSHSIFLPALFDTGSGNYLSSTLYDFESNSAKGLCFHMDGFGQTLLSRNKRFPVRPVLGNPPYVPVESVEFWFTHYFLDVGQIDYLSVDIIPANATNKTVTWSSSNESVAIVDQNGKLTARSVGGTYITAEVEGKRDEFYLRVSPVVHATFEPASMSLKVGESAEVTVILDSPGDLSTSGLGQSTPWIIDVQYISSNPIKFRVTGLSEGTGKFTFSANNSSYDYYVTVTKD